MAESKRYILFSERVGAVSAIIQTDTMDAHLSSDRFNYTLAFILRKLITLLGEQFDQIHLVDGNQLL